MKNLILSLLAIGVLAAVTGCADEPKQTTYNSSASMTTDTKEVHTR